MTDLITAAVAAMMIAPAAMPAHTHKEHTHTAQVHHFTVSDTVLTSFYGGGPIKYEPNTHTANGRRFNQWALTAAHRTLPFGTRLKVCYKKCTVVEITDRGPAKWTGRSLDVSRGAAQAIGMLNVGVARVRISAAN